MLCVVYLSTTEALHLGAGTPHSRDVLLESVKQMLNTMPLLHDPS